MVVYTSCGSDLHTAAREIATDLTERLVHDIEEIREDDPVVYVNSVSDLDENKLLRLQRNRLRGPYTPFSVVTGYTPSDHSTSITETRRRRASTPLRTYTGTNGSPATQTAR